MVDAATQRMNMVESQVLTSDVTDRRILRAMRELPREALRAGADGGARLHGRGGAAHPARRRPRAGCWRRVCWPSSCSSPRSAMTTACSMWAAPAATRRPCWPGWRKPWSPSKATSSLPRGAHEPCRPRARQR